MSISDNTPVVTFVECPHCHQARTACCTDDARSHGQSRPYLEKMADALRQKAEQEADAIRKELAEHDVRAHGPVSERFMRHHYGASGYVDPAKTVTFPDAVSVEMLQNKVACLERRRDEQEIEILRLRESLADAEQQLEVLRPGGLYAWKSKYDELLAALNVVRGCLMEPFVDTDGVARQYVKAIIAIEDVIAKTRQ